MLQKVLQGEVLFFRIVGNGAAENMGESSHGTRYLEEPPTRRPTETDASARVRATRMTFLIHTFQRISGYRAGWHEGCPSPCRPHHRKGDFQLKIRCVVLTLAAGALALAAQAAAQPPGGSVYDAGDRFGDARRDRVAAVRGRELPRLGHQFRLGDLTEQAQVYPAGGKALGGAKAKRLHGSPLAHATMARKTGLTAQLTPSTECNPMGGPPSNVVPGATICEEARLNPAAKLFVISKGYQVRPGQTAAAQKGTNIQFPPPPSR